MLSRLFFLILSYRTYLAGKWHLGLYQWESTPTFRGFDHHFGYWNGMEDYWAHSMSAHGAQLPLNLSDSLLDLHKDTEIVSNMCGIRNMIFFLQNLKVLVQNR